MMNKECTLIKTSELDQLREQANSKKSDFIDIKITARFKDTKIISNLNLSDNLRKQINNIISLARKKIYYGVDVYYYKKSEENRNKIHKNEMDFLIAELKLLSTGNTSRRKRRIFRSAWAILVEDKS